MITVAALALAPAMTGPVLIGPALLGRSGLGQNQKRRYGYGGGPYARVVVDRVTIPERGLLREGRVQLPMRAIFERLGATVRYNSVNHKVVAMTRLKTVSLVVGENFAYMPDSAYLDFPPRIVRGRVYVPVRFCGEALDAYVQWNRGNRTAYVFTNNPNAPKVKL